MRKQVSYLMVFIFVLCNCWFGNIDAYAMEINQTDEYIQLLEDEESGGTIVAYELDDLPQTDEEDTHDVSIPDNHLFSSNISFGDAGIRPSSVANRDLDIFGCDYIYQHMSEKQKMYYDRFKKISDDFLYGMEDAKLGSKNGMPVYLLGPVYCAPDDLQNIENYARIFIFQNPQYYFLTNSLFYTTDKTTMYFSVYPEFNFGDKRSIASKKFFDKLDAYVKTVQKEKTAYDKHRKAFDIVCDNLQYQIIDGYYDQTAYGAVMDGIAVCAGYTKFYSMLTNAVSIPTVGITSPNPNDLSKGLHAWNKVQLDGKWYNVDATWADTTPGSSRERFLDRSDSAMLKIDNGRGHHSPYSYYNGIAPTCPSDYVRDDHPAQPEKVVSNVSVSYRTHVQTFGWQNYVTNGVMSGTSGKAKRLEGIEIKVSGNKNLGIQYTTHCQSYGWMPWSSNGDMSGTQGEAKRLEAIKIQLTGVEKQYYDVYYRVHAQTYGWLGWAKNGEPAGSAGFSKRLEGIQIVVMKKGEVAPDVNYKGIKGNKNTPAYAAKNGYSPVVNHSDTYNLNPQIPDVYEPNISYRTHVQTYGWQGWKFNGDLAGTTGLGKRLEGIEIRLTNLPYSGGVRYRAHVQTYGWQGWKSNGQMAGTSGQGKRLESICIELTGEIAEYYDVYYRVHSQSFGWLGWAKNGEPAGTSGYGKRLESIQIGLVEKNAPFPTNTVSPYIYRR